MTLPYPLPQRTRVHHRLFRNYCGEVDAIVQLRFRHFVHLASLQSTDPVADFLVIHRRRADGVPEIPELPRCIEAMREQFGPVWYEDAELSVFRLGSESGDGL